MKQKKIEIKLSVWLTIDKLRLPSENGGGFVEQDEYLCFYNFSKPSGGVVVGELLKDDAGKPLLFKTCDEAVLSATKYLTNKHNQ
jgi:hypothetical protein